MNVLKNNRNYFPNNFIILCISYSYIFFCFNTRKTIFNTHVLCSCPPSQRNYTPGMTDFAFPEILFASFTIWSKIWAWYSIDKIALYFEFRILKIETNHSHTSPNYISCKTRNYFGQCKHKYSLKIKGYWPVIFYFHFGIPWFTFIKLYSKFSLVELIHLFLFAFQKWNVTSLAESTGKWKPSQRSCIHT